MTDFSYRKTGQFYIGSFLLISLYIFHPACTVCIFVFFRSYYSALAHSFLQYCDWDLAPGVRCHAFIRYSFLLVTTKLKLAQDGMDNQRIYYEKRCATSIGPVSDSFFTEQLIQAYSCCICPMMVLNFHKMKCPLLSFFEKVITVSIGICYYD